MRWLAGMVWVVGCATPTRVPDVFSPAAHASNYSGEYVPVDYELWRFGADPLPDTEVMRYVVAPQYPDPQPTQTDITYSSVGPWSAP